MMQRVAMFAFLALVVAALVFSCKGDSSPETLQEIVELPKPRLDGDMSVERALELRRSVREYSDESLSLDEVSQLLWAAQGITEPARGYRTAPSAGATYPLEVYAVVGEVQGLEPGLYRYSPGDNELIGKIEGDFRRELQGAALGQRMVGDAPLVILFTAVYERTTARYGQRGERYVHMEAGHAAQNIYLQVVSLNLVTVVVGAFNEVEVKDVLHLPQEEEPLYIIPVGRPKF